MKTSHRQPHETQSGSGLIELSVCVCYCLHHPLREAITDFSWLWVKQELVPVFEKNVRDCEPLSPTRHCHT